MGLSAPSLTMALSWWWWVRGPSGLLLLVMWMLLLPSGSCNEGSQILKDCSCRKLKASRADNLLYLLAQKSRKYQDCRDNQVMFTLNSGEQICVLRSDEWAKKLIPCVGSKTPKKCIEDQNQPPNETSVPRTKTEPADTPTKGNKNKVTTQRNVSTTEFLGAATKKGEEVPADVFPSSASTLFTTAKVQENNTMLTNQSMIRETGSSVLEEKPKSFTDGDPFKLEGGTDPPTGPDISTKQNKMALLSLIGIVFFLIIVIVVLVKRQRKGGSKKRNICESDSQAEMESLQSHNSTTMSATETCEVNGLIRDFE